MKPCVAEVNNNVAVVAAVDLPEWKDYDVMELDVKASLDCGQHLKDYYEFVKVRVLFLRIVRVGDIYQSICVMLAVVVTTQVQNSRLQGVVNAHPEFVPSTPNTRKHSSNHNWL